MIEMGKRFLPVSLQYFFHCLEKNMEALVPRSAGFRRELHLNGLAEICD